MKNVILEFSITYKKQSTYATQKTKKYLQTNKKKRKPLLIM